MENLGFVASEDLKRSEIMQKALLCLLGGLHKILAFFDRLPLSVDIFYVMNVDKKWTFLDHLPPPLINVVCERPLKE